LEELRGPSGYTPRARPEVFYFDPKAGGKVRIFGV